MKLIPGIGTYTYTWAIGVPGYEPKCPMDVFGLIDKAIVMDIKVVQIADNLPLEFFSAIELLQLKKYAKEKGIILEVGSKRMTHQRLDVFIRIATTLNSKILRFVIDGVGYTPNQYEIVRIIRKSLPKLKKNHIHLALENHDRMLTFEFVEILKKVDSRWVGICLDTVNSMGAGEGLETVMERLGPHTVNFHVKEFTVDRNSHAMGFTIEGLPLGKGMLPLKKLMEHIGPNCKTAILEQWVPPAEEGLQATIEKEDSWALESVQFLKKAVAL